MQNHAALLESIAHQAMIDRGLRPDFSKAAQKQLDSIPGPANEDHSSIRDLRHLLWSSIDNDDSRDLDQLTVAEDLGGGKARLLVAVADVDALVKRGSAIDDHARQNTTSVYTAAKIFPMLPEKLSTDLTSLNEGDDRMAMVVEISVDAEGKVIAGDVYRARVRNKAKLTYNAVGMWLEEHSEAPEKVQRLSGLAENLRLQDRTADRMRELRQQHGALDLETIEARAVLRDGQVVDLRQEARNNARNLIEDFMIAANGVTARFLASKQIASIRRVVRSPERWDRIVAIAAEFGERLPADPDARALEEFLHRRRRADRLRFPDLSLAIVKAMGPGEYVLEKPGQQAIGHFGLAVRDYTHSTAPNRRFPDLITHRLLKAALSGSKPPYSEDQLQELAQHCTNAEDAANKVERQVRKSAAALLLSSRIGERFDAIVTGASPKGTWVRIFHPPVEGKLVRGDQGVDIGDRLRVKLISVDVPAGYIDFARSRR